MQQRNKGLTSTADPPELEILHTAEEIQDLVGYAPSTIIRKAREGLFPHHRYGQRGGLGEIRFTDEDVAKIRALAVRPQRANSEIQPKSART